MAASRLHHKNYSLPLLALTLLLQLAFSHSLASAQPNNARSKRVVYYYQTQFANGDTGSFISLLPLISPSNLNSEGNPFTTDVLVGAFHLGPEKDKTQIHLNDLPPNASRFDILWHQTAILKSKGINVNMFLGGARYRSFQNLALNSSYYYPILRRTIQTYNFNGVDLDVEDDAETTAQIEALIRRLRSDFGQGFIITLAPVVTDLVFNDLAALSNINYTKLYKDMGSNLSWFNVQFYNGFGTLESPEDYTAVVNNRFPANVIVAGMLSNPANGNDFVNITIVNHTVTSLIKQYPHFGGVAAFEYFDALPGGTAAPAKWGTYFGKLMGLS